MPGLRKEVEGLDVLDGVAGGGEFLEVAHLGGGFAGNVDAAGGGVVEKLGKEFWRTAGARWIDEDGGFFRWKIDFFENGLGAGGYEFCVVDVI